MLPSGSSGLRSLRRLLRIRELEEEQCRIGLEAALGELRRLEQAETAAAERGRRGRRLVAASASGADPSDRQAGLEEMRAAERMSRALAPRRWSREQEVARLRQAYLDKRVERRQAETLIAEAVAGEAREAERRGQQGLDDWFRNRIGRSKRAKEGQDRSMAEEKS